MTEDEIKSLPEPQRSETIQRVLAILTPTRALSRHVIGLGAAAMANKDFQTAEQQLEAVSNFGEMMAQPRHMLVVQLVGKAVEKGATDQLVVLYKATQDAEKLKAAEERLKQLSRK